jgi:hypothetical protein
VSDLKRQLQEFLSYVDDLETKVREARLHIRRHLDAFAPEELECMVIDGLIAPEDVPPEKRTEDVQQLLDMSRGRAKA